MIDIGYREVQPIGNHIGYGHTQGNGEHWWGPIPLPTFPDSPKGRELRRLRCDLHLTLREAARIAGIDVVQFSALERGGAQCNWEALEQALRESRK